jgi:hypothetical protein
MISYRKSNKIITKKRENIKKEIDEETLIHMNNSPDFSVN